VQKIKVEEKSKIFFSAAIAQNWSFLVGELLVTGFNMICEV